MRNLLSRLVWPFALPAAVVLASIWFCSRLPALPSEWREAVLLTPYMIILGGLLLSLRFNRSCAFFCLLIIGVTYTALGPMLPLSEEKLLARMVFTALCTIVPMNMVLLSLMKERGILSSHGLLRFGFILAQVAALSFTLLERERGLLRYLSRDFTVPFYAHVVIGCCLGIMVLKILLRPSAIDRGLLGALAVMAIAVNRIRVESVELEFAVYVSAAGLALSLSIVQRSHDMAYSDELTRLPGRRALDERLMEMGQRYVIAMVDIDHFKGFNDKYGHSVGDDVLRLVASRLKHVGCGGRAYRYGGEEFALVFRRRALKEVLPYLEALRQSIADYQLTIRSESRPPRARQGRKMRTRRQTHKGVTVTISTGVAERNDRFRTPDEVIVAADKALYRAKGRGRNRVCSATG